MSKKKSVAPTSLVTFLLDRSGSMASIKDATIEAFNAYLAGLKAEKEAAITFSFLQFDNVSLDKVCVALPIADVPDLTDVTFQPRGGTPLIDAAYKTIQAVAESLRARDDKPKVIVCIQTDGEENSSREHSWNELKELIAGKQAAGWEFLFMGAGIDAYAQARNMGISVGSTVSYDSADMASTRHAFAASAANTADFSGMRRANTAYTISQKAGSGDRFDPTLNPNVASVGITLTASVGAATPTTKPVVKKAVSDFAL